MIFQLLCYFTATKVSPGGDIAETLGLSALIINDLKQKRRKHYEFNWDKALKVNFDFALSTGSSTDGLTISNVLPRTAISGKMQLVAFEREKNAI